MDEKQLQGDVGLYIWQFWQGLKILGHRLISGLLTQEVGALFRNWGEEEETGETGKMAGGTNVVSGTENQKYGGWTWKLATESGWLFGHSQMAPPLFSDLARGGGTVARQCERDGGGTLCFESGRVVDCKFYIISYSK